MRPVVFAWPSVVPGSSDSNSMIQNTHRNLIFLDLERDLVCVPEPVRDLLRDPLGLEGLRVGSGGVAEGLHALLLVLLAVLVDGIEGLTVGALEGLSVGALEGLPVCVAEAFPVSVA